MKSVCLCAYHVLGEILSDCLVFGLLINSSPVSRDGSSSLTSYIPPTLLLPSCKSCNDNQCLSLVLTGVLRKINEPKFGINALHVRFLNHVNCGIVSYVVSFRVIIELYKL